MITRLSLVRRAALGAVALVLAVSAVGTVRAQGGPARPAAASLVQQVRIALGHGSPAEGRRLVEAAPPQAAGRELAAAMVDEFEGKDDQARTRLVPLAAAAPLGDAAVELAWLEFRHGRRDEALRLFTPLAAVRQFSGPDDYFRLARAAPGIHEFLLANDAYIQTKDVPRADIQTEWGDLLLRRHKVELAAEAYQDALKADPNWVRALLGLSRVFADAEPEEAKKAFEAAKKLAPDHPDVLLLAAERQIEVEDNSGAKATLDKLAAVRPGTVDEAALRVGLAYAENGLTAVDAALPKVAAINPRSAQGLRAAGQQAAHDYRFEDGVALLRKGISIDPDDADAHLELGLYLLRTGDEKDARAQLDWAWNLDNSNQVTFNLLKMMDSLEKFEVVEAGNLQFKFAKDEAAVLKAYALPLGEAAYKTFVARYGFTPKGPILIEIFPTHDDFAVRTIGLPGITGALGACFGRVVSMDSPRARPPGEFSWHATEWHELAHVFTLQLSDYRVPRWLTEGISVFEEHLRQPAWGREMALEYARALGKGKTFGVKGLPEAFKNPENYSLAYFEASLVVEHLVELNGDAGLRTLLRAYAERATDAQAFEKAFGKSIDTVEASFKSFVDQRYGALRDAMKDAPSQVDFEDLPGLKARAAAAPRNYISQITFGQALYKAGQYAEARPVLEKAAELAPQASGDVSPHGLLAQIAVRDGDQVRARRELRALLTYDHANVNAARRLATLAAEAKAVEDQDYALRLVADLDPFDAETHGVLGTRLMAKSDFAAAQVEFQAALALGPANLAVAHADLAEAFLKLGRRDDAKREALAALKEAPTFARAQELLLAAMGRH